jgi:predicted alpha/beta superfamily hydrolase
VAPWSGDRHLLRSRHVDDDFVVGVTRPHGYDRSTADYPLLVTLDAHWLFGTVSDLATSLSMGRAIPRVLVAGVGWPTDDLAEIARYRHRDATPTAAPFPEEGFGERPGRHGLGGAGPFRRFVLDELLPFLSETYRVGRPRLLVGHSLTGLFGVHLLLREPAAFDGYLLASPSLWWDDRVTLRVTEPEIGPRWTPSPARVYLSAGAEEGANQRTLPFNMVGNVGELARRLAVYEGLDVAFDILEGETHHSTLGQSVSRGLRHLLAAEVPAPTTRPGPAAPTA